MTTGTGYAFLIKRLDGDVYDMLSQSVCSICTSIFNVPVTTECGHTFCGSCIRRVLSNKNNSGCPLCKFAVNRRDLKNDKMQQLISDVCRLLPDAFKADVENLSNEFNIIRDDISTCKTFDFCSPKNEKKKGKKGRPPNNKTETDNFVPVVRKSDKVYHNKKKDVDDLVSISQIEPEFHTVTTTKTDDKLEKVAKVPPEEKINNWLEIAGENLFNTSSTSIFGEKPAEKPEETKKSSMIRVDYNKDKSSSSSDPYEFVASQKNYPEKKKRGRKPNPVKKVPDFQAIQSFTKESVRRTQMALEEEKEEEHLINFDERALDEILSPHKFADTLKVPTMTASQKFDNLMDESVDSDKLEEDRRNKPGCSKDLSPTKLITASQKFDDLLEETGGDKGPAHVLYSPKSDQSLMCTYESEKDQRLKLVAKDPSSDTSDLGVADLFSTPKQKRKKSNEGGAKKKSRLVEILQEVKDDENIIFGESLMMPRRSSDATSNISGVSKSPGWSRVSGLKNDFEKAKRGRPKKLKSLNVSGGEKAMNFSKSNLSVDVDEGLDKIEMAMKNADDYIEDLSQVSELVTGFSDQALNEEEEKFKKMVEDMEEELDRSNSEFTLDKDSSEGIIPETESVDVVKEMEVEKPGEVPVHESETDEDFADAIAQVFENPVEKIQTPETLKTKVPAPVTPQAIVQVSEAANATEEAPEAFNATVQEPEAPKATSQTSKAPEVFTPPQLAITSTPVVTAHAPAIAAAAPEPCASPIFLPPAEISAVEEPKTSCAASTSTSIRESSIARKRRSTPFKLQGRVQKKKKSSTIYIQLGKLAPLLKAKSTVLKFVIPTNKKRKQRRSTIAIQSLSSILPDVSSVASNKRDSYAQTSQEDVPEVHSIGVQMTQVGNKSSSVQTSPKTHSIGVQMTQVDNKSSSAQTSQPPLQSVGVQMTQRNNSAGCQTSQTGRSSIGLQMTQVRNNSAAVQTTQSPLLSVGLQMTQKKKILAASQSSQLYRPSIGLQMSQVAPPETTQHKDMFPSLPSEVFRSRLEKESEWEEIENLDQLKSQPEEIPKPSENSVLVDQEIENEFNKTFNTQKKIESQKNIQDYFPKSSKRMRRISSGDLESPVEVLPEKFEGRQFLPLNVQKIPDEPVALSETIDLESPQINTQQQVQNVLSNIENDLARIGRTNEKEEELPKSQGEESDTDIFVSQTPPRLNSSKILEITPRPQQDDQNTENTEVIADSVPSKEIDRCMMENDDQKFKTPPRRSILKPANLGFPSRESFFRKEDPDENDQNKINNEEKTNQVKAIMESWKNGGKRRLCIVSSSVHNPENVQKFVERFKCDFAGSVTKEVTHLVVGLHQNEADEVLPLLTPKFLFALAYKKWIVTEAWVEACLKANAIVPEEQFESLDTLGGDSCKRARLSTEPLLKDFEIFMYGKFEKITKEELANVLTACGATVITHPSKFSSNSTKIRIIIIDKECNDYEVDQIQGLFKKYNTVVLSREFVVTVIEGYRLVNFTSFLATLTSEDELLALGYPLFLAKHEEDSEAIFR